LARHVEIARESCSFTTAEALANILPDLKKWSLEPGRSALAIALSWYVMQVENAYKLKESLPYSINNFFCHGIGGLSSLYTAYPAPTFWNDGQLDGNEAADGEESQNMIYEFNYEASSTFWMLRVIYDFLCAPDIESLQKQSACPLYDKCTFRPELDEDHTCKTAPWEIVKGKAKPPCPYGEAAASMGLWQNQVDFIF